MGRDLPVELPTSEPNISLALRTPHCHALSTLPTVAMQLDTVDAHWGKESPRLNILTALTW